MTTSPAGSLNDGLDRLFDSWPTAVLLVNENGLIERANEEAEKLFGYSPEEFFGLAIEALVPKQYRNRHSEHRADFQANPHSRRMAEGASFRAERADGSEFPAEVSLEPVTFDGRTFTWATVKDASQGTDLIDIPEQERRSLIGIGQMTASAVDFQSRQREFGTLIRSLVPTDFTTITTLLPDNETQYIAYLDYDGVPPDDGPAYGSKWPIEGSTAEEILATGKPVIRNFDTNEQFRKRYPGRDNRNKDRHIKSVLNVPLIANGNIFGFLTFRSFTSRTYTPSDLRRGRAIAEIIAGSVAQAELRRRQAETEAHHSVLRSMGQLLSSTLDPGEVLEDFADLATKVIKFNVIGVVRLEHERQLVTLDHMIIRGSRCVTGREPGSTYSSRGTMMERHKDANEPVLISKPDTNAVLAEYPGAAPTSEPNHFLSTILVPLLKTPSFNAALLIQSEDELAYSDADLQAASDIALAIKGPLASAYVHTREMELARERELNLQAEFEKKRLSEINEAKSQFLGLLSHELKTPLTSITAFSDLLHRNRYGNLKEREMQQVDAIRRNSHLLESLITDLLELSRMEAGRIAIEPSAFLPMELVSTCVDELQSAFEAKSQSVVVNTNDETTHLVGDANRLRQVLINLISNASKYSPDETTITVTVNATPLQLSVSVEDEGDGISEEDSDQVFELFNRGSNATTLKQPGTGIGLYIARKVVEAHQGKISLKPRPEGGSIASFSIPTRQVSRQIDAAAD